MALIFSRQPKQSKTEFFNSSKTHKLKLERVRVNRISSARLFGGFFLFYRLCSKMSFFFIKKKDNKMTLFGQ